MRQDKMWEEQVQTLKQEKAALQAQVQAIQAALVAVLSQVQAQGITVTVDVSTSVGLAGNFLPASPQPQLLPTLPVIEEVPSSPPPISVTAVPTSPAVSASTARESAAQAISPGSIPDSVTAAEIIAAVASRTVDGHKQGGVGADLSSPAPAAAAAPAAAIAPVGGSAGSKASKGPFRTLRSGCDGEDVKQMQVRGVESNVGR